MKPHWVVDSNVLIVANGDETDQADDDCRSACEEFLVELRESAVLVFDDGGEILNEYGIKCSHAGAPGLGDMFFRWAFETQYTDAVRVPLTSHPDRVFEEFPDLVELSTFDLSDRKFAAAALASAEPTTVANAVDSDWRDHLAGFSMASLEVLELCQWCLKVPQPDSAS